MVTERQLLSSPEYFMETLQNELFRQLEAYREANGYNRTKLAEDLGFSKGYVTRLLNGDFNHSAQKLIELALKIGKAPVIQFKDLDEYITDTTDKRHRGRIIPLPIASEMTLGSSQEAIAAVSHV